MENYICKHSFKIIIKDYFKNLINSYRGKNLLKTIILSVVIGAISFLLALYVFKNDDPIMIGILTPLFISIIINIFTNTINLKGKYFVEIKNSFIFLAKGFITRKTGIVEKVLLIIFSVIGILLAIYFNNLLTLLIGIAIYLSVLKTEKSLVLSIVYSFINVFNKDFRNHRRVELLFFGLSMAMILTNIIMFILGVML